MNPNTDERIAIAIVEDDIALCNALQFSLQFDGFTATTYSTAGDFLGEPCLTVDGLVVDQRLPDMLGIDLLRRLRLLGNTTPAVLMTSYPTRELRSRAAMMDIVIIEKPLLGSELLEEIRRITAPCDGTR